MRETGRRAQRMALQVMDRLSGRGPRRVAAAAVLAAVLAIAAVPAAYLVKVVFTDCRDGQVCEGPAQAVDWVAGMMLYTMTISFVLLVVTWGAMMVVRVRERVLARKLSPSLVQCRDWFANGLVARERYEAYRARAQGLAEATDPALVRRARATRLTWTAWASLALAVPLALLTFGAYQLVFRGYYVNQWDYYLLTLLPITVLTALLSLLALSGLLVGIPLGRDARRRLGEALAWVREEEAAMLQEAHAAATAAPRRRQPPQRLPEMRAT